MFNDDLGFGFRHPPISSEASQTSSMSTLFKSGPFNSTNTTNLTLELLSNSTADVSASETFSEATANLGDILLGIVSAVIVLTTLIGNIMVIIAVFTYRPLKTVQNFFIVSLAAADISVSVLVLPFNVASSLIGRWVFGITFCDFWLTADVFCCTASILNLCAIAMDRYWAIHDPLNYAQKRTMNRILGTIAIVWVLSACISSPPLFGWRKRPEIFFAPDNTVQNCILTEHQGYVIYSASGSFFIPLGIMTFVYIRIYFAIKARLQRRRQGGSSGASSAKRPRNRRKFKDPKMSLKSMRQTMTTIFKRNGTTQTTISSKDEDEVFSQNGGSLRVPKHETSSDEKSSIREKNPTERAQKQDQMSTFVAEKQKISLKKERKAARTLAIVMVVFVVCWLPFFLMYVILSFCKTCTPPSKELGQFITWLGYVNSSLNPVIYTIFNTDFRRAFKQMLFKNKLCACWSR